MLEGFFPLEKRDDTRLGGSEGLDFVPDFAGKPGKIGEGRIVYYWGWKFQARKRGEEILKSRHLG